MGSDNLLARNAQYFPKEPHSETFVEWHQVGTTTYCL